MSRRRRNKKTEEVMITDSGVYEKNTDIFGITVSIITFFISFWLIFLGALAILY